MAVQQGGELISLGDRMVLSPQTTLAVEHAIIRLPTRSNSVDYSLCQPPRVTGRSFLSSSLTFFAESGRRKGQGRRRNSGGGREGDRRA